MQLLLSAKLGFARRFIRPNSLEEIDGFEIFNI